MQTNTVKIVKKIMPAVVSIVVSENINNLSKEILTATTKKKLKKISDRRGNIEIGGGSGFIIDKNGIIITSKHIISDPEADYAIITSDNKKHKAKIIYIAPHNDIAILKIQTSYLCQACPSGRQGFGRQAKSKIPKPVKLGDSDKIQLGENVLAFGSPLGQFPNTVSEGIVSGLHRKITAKTDLKSNNDTLKELIQTDAAINPGNSGGPLINMEGEAIGINTIAVANAENIGLAIPINEIKEILKLKKVKNNE